MTASPTADRLRLSRSFFRRLTLTLAAIGLVSGCVTNDRGGPSNQAIGTGLGMAAGAGIGAAATRGSLGGILVGALIGGIAGNVFGRMLDREEQRKLNEATYQAYATPVGQVTTYSVPSKKAGVEATQVSARPTGPATPQASGGTCRPIERTATKNGQTQSDVVTFCQGAGGGELKAVSI